MFQDWDAGMSWNRRRAAIIPISERSIAYLQTNTLIVSRVAFLKRRQLRRGNASTKRTDAG
jgi:hypothetical protein